MPLFCTPCQTIRSKGGFFLLPISYNFFLFSGMLITPMKCSISCAKVFPCSSRRSKFEFFRFVKNLPLSVPASVFVPEKLSSAKHYLSLPLKLDHS